MKIQYLNYKNNSFYVKFIYDFTDVSLMTNLVIYLSK